jgi:NAD(P)H-hydrate epimerase
LKEILNSIQAKSIDTYSISKIGIPSVVLMERAALAVAEAVTEKLEADHRKGMSEYPVLIACGTGNNGADGLAVARLLAQAGVYVDVCITDGESEGTEEYRTQKAIVERLTDRNKYLRCQHNPVNTYNYIVDALFGIGLNRSISGAYASLVKEINDSSAYVFAIDAPSGVNCSTGEVLGTAVIAHETITFGYNKTGMALEPGRSHAGKITVADIGFVTDGFDKYLAVGGNDKYIAYGLDDSDIANIPKRSSAVDKGKCGKVLIIAGSETMGGAAVLSAEAALRSGCGLVKVFTHENNRGTLLKNVVEAIPVTYTDNIDELMTLCNWADCIVVGPGLSTDERAKQIFAIIMEFVANENIAADHRYVIMDADALNLLARIHGEGKAEYRLGSNVIITPHVGEASRLLGTSIDVVKDDLIASAKRLAKEYGCTAVLKDAASVITDGERVFINTSGNPGMATAGSGDVLTGVLAGVVCAYRGDDIVYYAALASYIHGRAGVVAQEKLGIAGMKAMDIAENVPYVMKDVKF